MTAFLSLPKDDSHCIGSSVDSGPLPLFLARPHHAEAKPHAVYGCVMCGRHMGSGAT